MAMEVAADQEDGFFAVEAAEFGDAFEFHAAGGRREDRSQVSYRL